MATRARAKVTDRDHGWKELFGRVRALGRDDSYVRVGILGSKAAQKEGGLDTVGLALIHEFGSPQARIPQRSWIRSTFDMGREKYQATLHRGLEAFIAHKLELRQVFGIVGAQIKADIQRRVMSGEGIPPPNAPETIRRKGSSRPLVDTGRMVASVDWEVTIAGEGKGKS